MVMKNSDYLSWTGTIFGTIFTATQTDQILQYISIAITIISTLFSIAFTIYRWHKNATKDGKVTSDEIEDLGNQIGDILNKKGDKKDEEN